MRHRLSWEHLRASVPLAALVIVGPQVLLRLLPLPLGYDAYLFIAHAFFFVPLYLLTACFSTVSLSARREAIRFAVLAGPIAVAGQGVGYVMWGLWSGMLLEPDSPTLGIIYLALIFQLAGWIVGTALGALNRYMMRGGSPLS